MLKLFLLEEYLTSSIFITLSDNSSYQGLCSCLYCTFTARLTAAAARQGGLFVGLPSCAMVDFTGFISSQFPLLEHAG